MSPAKGEIVRKDIAVFALVSCFFLFGAADGAVDEVWVVNQNSQDLAIIDTAGEVVSGRISLGLGTSDLPFAVAFSTAPDAQGAYAFVTQGQFLRVIDAFSRTVTRTLNMEDVLGEVFELRGVAAGLPIEVRDAQGTVIRSFLFVGARRQCCDGNAYYVIFDQEALITGGPGSRDLVDFAPLETGASTAQSVEVMEAPGGDERSRAIFTVYRGAPGAPTHLVAHQVFTDGSAAVWRHRVLRTTAVPGGTPVSDAIGASSPFQREMQAMPEGGSGRIVNLRTGDSCTIAGANFGATSLNGPGPNRHDLLALDPLAGKLFSIDPVDCADTQYTVGAEPSDVEHLNVVDGPKAYVSNFGDGSVSILQEDQTITTIEGVGDGPRALAPRRTAQACRINNVTITKGEADSNVLNWNQVSCPTETLYQIWCTCQEPGCPVDCQPPLPPSNPEALTTTIQPLPPDGPIAEGQWLPLGTVGCCTFIHPDGGSANINYLVEPQ